MHYLIVRFLKLLVTFFVRIIFRLEVKGLENIPKQGGALIIANHVSFLDNLVLITSLPRDVGFVMAAKVYNHPMLRWIFKKLPMVPIETGKNRSYLQEFNKSCQEKINNGNLVCVYAEGQISNNGHLLAFKKGMEYIAEGLQKSVPIIPIHIDGLLGTPLSYDNIEKKTIKFGFKNLFKKVVVSIGNPLDNQTSSFKTRQAMKDLEVVGFSERIPTTANLLSFVEKQKTSWSQNVVLNDLTAIEIWEKAEGLAFVLKAKVSEYNVVGLSFKEQNLVSVTNIALSILGKTVVNVPSSKLEPSALHQSGIEFFITDNEIEFQHYNIDRVEFKKEQSLERFQEINKTVEVARFMTTESHFSLSHENLLAYLFAIKQLFALRGDSFIYNQYDCSTPIGYFMEVWAPVLANVTVLNERNKSKANVLIGNADFVNQFQKEYGTESLRTIILLDSKETELNNDVNREVVYQGLRSRSACPVLTLSSPDYQGKSIAGKPLTQKGREQHSVGRPLPGVTIKIVNSEGVELDANSEGKVYAKGVLFGSKGWIDSGIIGQMTEEGFLKV